MGEGRSRHLSVFLAAVLLSTLGGQLAAQSTGNVEGQITNADGQPLPGVTVTLLQPGHEGSQEKTSDAEGRFRFGGLSYGVYTVRASLEGYEPAVCPGGRVLPGQTRSFAIRLLPTGEQASACTAAASGS